MRDVLDRQLGRFTTYRLVTVVLGALVVVMVAFTAAGTFTSPFTVRGEILTLAVLLAASYVSSRVLGLIWRVKPHVESSIVTALLLWFIFWPSIRADDLGWLAATALLANLSKYVLVWHGRHVFNPTAAGSLLVVVVQDLVGRDLSINPTWWIASERLLPFVAVAAFLVLWRIRRIDIGVLFILVAGVFTVIGLLDASDASLGEVLKTVAYSYPIVFIAGFMVTEPLTLPPRRRQQLLVAAIAAFVLAWPQLTSALGIEPISIGAIFVSPELALLVGNLVAFAMVRRRGLDLVLRETRQLSPEIHDLTFRTRRQLTFVPGQYVELTVPHGSADSRGSRRTFSISSPPNDDGDVKLTLRVPEKSSSFKRALLELEPGDTIRATGIGGDFLWPADASKPLLLVAGGIGITPFLSQLRHDPDRDAVLVYGVSSPEEVPFTDELIGARVVLVGPSSPEQLPAGWTFVQAPGLTVDLIAKAVPDLAGRQAFISGPPAMVNALRPGLAKQCGRVSTDYFTGY